MNYFIKNIFCLVISGFMFLPALCSALVAKNIVVIGSNVDDEGGKNIVLTSPNGVSWSPTIIPNSPHFSDGVVAQNKYTIAGKCRLNLGSRDGISWKSHRTPFCFDRILWSHKQYFAFFNDPDSTTVSLYTSPDGLTFQKRFTGPDIAIGGIARGKGRYVAAAMDIVNADPNNQGMIFTSPEGIQWTQVPKIVIPGQLYDIAFHTLFVAVGTNIITSPNGTLWTTHKNPAPDKLQSIAWGNSAFVAVGFAGSIVRSEDGIHWAAIKSKTTQNLYKVIWTDTNTQFVAVGAQGTILTSPDGTHWTPQKSGTTLTLSGVAGPYKYIYP